MLLFIFIMHPKTGQGCFVTYAYQEFRAIARTGVMLLGLVRGAKKLDCKAGCKTKATSLDPTKPEAVTWEASFHFLLAPTSAL